MSIKKSKETNDSISNMESFRLILKEKEFIKVATARMISRFGDSIDFVAYGWMVYEITGSTTILAMLYAVNSLPSILLNIFAGTIVTYLPKKTVIIISDLSRACIVMLTACLYILGILEVWYLFLFTFLNSVFEVIRPPASIPLLARLIPEKLYDYGISTNNIATTFAELIGFSIAGVLVSWLGVGTAIVIDAFTFIISGLIIVTVRAPREDFSTKNLEKGQYLHELRAGINYVLSNRLVFYIALFSGLLNLFLVPFSSLQPAYVKDILNMGPNAISIIAVASLVFMLIGSVFAPKIKNSYSGKTSFIFSGVILGIGYIFMAFLGHISSIPLRTVSLVLASGIMGFAIPFMNLPIQSALMSKVNKDYLSRTVSVMNAFSLSTSPIGSIIVSSLIVIVNLKSVFVLFGISILILFIIQIGNKTLNRL